MIVLLAVAVCCNFGVPRPLRRRPTEYLGAIWGAQAGTVSLASNNAVNTSDGVGNVIPYTAQQGGIGGWALLQFAAALPLLPLRTLLLLIDALQRVTIPSSCLRRAQYFCCAAADTSCVGHWRRRRRPSAVEQYLVGCILFSMDHALPDIIHAAWCGHTMKLGMRSSWVWCGESERPLE